jgi:hypothetical protein
MFCQWTQYKNEQGVFDIPLSELLDVGDDVYLPGVLDALRRGYASQEKAVVISAKEADKLRPILEKLGVKDALKEPNALAMVTKMESEIKYSINQ